MILNNENMCENYHVDYFIMTCPHCNNTTLEIAPWIAFARRETVNFKCGYCGKDATNVPYCSYMGSLESFGEFNRWNKSYLDSKP